MIFKNTSIIEVFRVCFGEVMLAYGLEIGFLPDQMRRFFKKDDKNAQKITKKYKSVRLLYKD